jgi:hypothetical protein
MTRVFVFFLTLIFIVSCSDRKKIPSDVIPPDKMGEILFSLGEAEEFSYSFIEKKLNVEKNKSLSIEAERVMKVYGITQDEFRTSYNFYKGRPDLFKVLMDSVSARKQRGVDKLFDKQPLVPQ